MRCGIIVNINEVSQMIGQRQEFERKVSMLVSRLPPMPDNINRLLNMAGKGSIVESTVLEMIKADSGLCANLLHLANTFRNDYEAPIDTIEGAVDNVGVLPLVQLIRIWYANQAINTELNKIEHIEDYSVHSQNISLGCKILAGLLKLENQESQMFATAGLIHDIGRLVLLLASDRKKVNLLGTSVDKLDSIIRNENEMLGMNHCEVGMYICQKWNLSDLLQQGILRHHTPLIGQDFNFTGALIFIAHFLTESDFTGETVINLLPKELIKKISLSTNDFKHGMKTYKLAKSKNKRISDHIAE
jgi:HD-like signal output (HDOD) protein